MLARLLFAIRSFFRMLGRLRRSMRTAPDTIVLELEGDYPYFTPPPSNFVEARLRRQQTDLRDIARRLRRIAADERVTGVILHLRGLSMPAAKVEVVRRLLAEVREAGKRVIVFSTEYSRNSYMLACAADEIYMMPVSMLGPLGLANQYRFLGDTLAQAGLQGDFVAITPYKSAADTLTRSSMSDAVREMANWLLDATYEELITTIAQGRGVSEGEARTLVDQTPCTSTRAAELGLIDGVITEEELPTRLGGELPRLATWDEADSVLCKLPLHKPGKYVAVVSIDGMIVDGKSRRAPVPLPVLGVSQAGDQSVVQAVRKAARSDRAAAIVVWVDSRGGAATASEAMASALRAVEKPVIVVMGTIAASGGYWVSTPGQHIVASANTLTGSIGVLSGKIAYSGLLDRLEVGREILKRGAHSDFLLDEGPLNEWERAFLRENIQMVYDVFLDRVAESRGMSREAVDAVGGGRVWTGRQALEHGLVDEIGDLDTGIKRAREAAGLDERAPAVLVRGGKSTLLPQVPEEPAALLRPLRALNRGAAFAIMPLDWLP